MQPATTIMLGIDIESRAVDIRCLVRSGFRVRCSQLGLDIDDLLQVVYLRILVANDGRAAFDPRRASFGGYVHLQANSALRNMLDKRRRKSWLQVGYVDPTTDRMEDAAWFATTPLWGDGEVLDGLTAARALDECAEAMGGALTDGETIAVQHLLEGHTPRMAAEAAGMTVADVTALVDTLRDALWATSRQPSSTT
jgi:DNA-directed RNA polymerase specialized sigma24 family protein